jgi:hypothetical protein
MSEKAYHGNKWMPVMYATYYGILKEIAIEHGYALALHGTLGRDLDLIAVPWIENPKDPIKMLKSFREGIGFTGTDGESYDTLEQKPHGRIAYTIQSGGGGYFDISIMPCVDDKGVEE